MRCESADDEGVVSRIADLEAIEREARAVSHHATSDEPNAHYAYFDALTRLRALLNKRVSASPSGGD